MSDFASAGRVRHSTQPDGHGLTSGLLLRRAREAAGLHPEALAATLKVPVQKIQALEADRLDLLPDLVFVRALASSICRTLAIDAHPVLERLPRKVPARLAQDRDRVNAPFCRSNEAASPGWRERFFRPQAIAVLALLLGALVLMLLPQSFLDDAVRFTHDRIEETSALIAAGSENDPAAPASRTGQPPMILSEAVVAGPPVQTAAAVSLASDTAGATPMLVGGLQPAGPTAEAPMLDDAQVTGTAPADAPAADLAPTRLLVFRTTGESWVEVKDAQGAVAMRRLLAAGETVDASGQVPLSVTIGKADVIQVHVRGRAFDLAAVSRDNVARFQVK